MVQVWIFRCPVRWGCNCEPGFGVSINLGFHIFCSSSKGTSGKSGVSASRKLKFETSNCFEIDGHTVNTVHTVDFEALLVIGGDAPQSGVHVLHAEFL